MDDKSISREDHCETKGRDLFKEKKRFTLNDINAKFRKSPSTLDELKFHNNQRKEEKEERKLKKKGEQPFVSFIGLFRYATWIEVAATWFGIVMGLATAWGLPLVIMIYGEFTNLMVERSKEGGTSTPTIVLQIFGGGEIISNGTTDQNNDALANDARAFGISSVVIAGTQFIAGILCVHALNWSANRQIARIRLLFLKSVLRQDMAWYDTQQNLNFASKITDDLNKLNEGIGEKIGMFCYLVFSFIFSVTVAFLYGWKLTLVVMTSTPVIIVCAALVAKAQSSLTVKELNSYSYAGSAAEEVLSAIRTVIAFGGEDREIKRYAERLGPANKAAVRRGMITGLGGGIMWLIMYCSFSLAFWYGVNLIQEEEVLPPDQRNYTAGILVIVLWGIVGGAQNLGLCSPHTEAFAAARGAAYSVFEIIARKPIIDSMSEEGEKPEKFSGDIKLTDVHFKYPSRPDVKVLTGLSLDIKAGETVALVGSSGCGKSTVLQLIQRLYDPFSGKVEIDGKMLTSLNVAWVRSNLGVVGQEPVLFSGTIRENIARGKPNCTEEEIENSAIAANCHDFIMKLPLGYNTTIGERGAQLSGGQKQRIAIARSLIRNPKVLLLDEATSALDAQGERKVQDALDKASCGRTTVMVSHRLSTVTNASRIVYIEQGKVVEQGTHEQLLAAKGYYWKLVQADIEHQQSAKMEQLPEENDDEDEERQESKSHPVQRVQSLRELSPDSIKLRSQESLRRVVQKRNSVSSVHSFGRNPRVMQMDDTDDPEDDDEIENEKLERSVSNWKLLRLNRKEWPYILFGSISSLIVGGVLPVFAYLFSKVYGLLSLPDPDEISRSTAFYCALFVIVGILCGVGTFLQSYLFTTAGVRLTQRLRVRTFANFLKQEMGWYDDQTNSVGALCARLSGDAAAVQGATGMRIGTILQGISTLVIGVLMAMVFSWKMTLVSLVTIPLVLGGIYFEGKIIRNSQYKERRAMEGASKIATEAIMNIRTVHSMGAEQQFLEKYEHEIMIARKAGGIRSRLRGAVYSLGLTAPSFGYGISLYYGGLLVAYEGLPYENVILVSEALIFGSWMLGQVLAFAPNFNAAKISGARILRLMERDPLIKSSDKIKDDPAWTANGAIEYSGIEFSYPVRKDAQVLRGFQLNVQPGQTVALVGHSGCGKSTAIQLLQRLYEPKKGTVKLDEHDVSKELTVPRLRGQLGLVSQEPTLFDRTIAENIAYGDNSRRVTRQEIIQAAIKTNIHGFISGLPLGYDTPLGAKGAQLSGGQKQRIAIARALVRNPRVLLLDEATSALDTQSEKLVQQALDAAKEGRTCITIAHRLSTIQNADVICVIDKGRVVEKGKHHELLAKKGLYAELYSMQALSVDSAPTKQTGPEEVQNE